MTGGIDAGECANAPTPLYRINYQLSIPKIRFAAINLTSPHRFVHGGASRCAPIGKQRGNFDIIE